MSVHVFDYSSKAWSNPFKMAATANNLNNSTNESKSSVVVAESHQHLGATHHRGAGNVE